MFWRVSGVNTASPVDAILDKEDFTLEELLNEDELIQECKALNARLTSFLKKKETVERLITYLVEDPPEECDAKRQFKYPFAACEIFCCEVESVYNTLLENDDLMDQLFGLVHKPRPLNSMLAGYFARVIGSLLFRCGSDVMQYLQRHQDLLPALVHHVDTTSVAEVLARVIGADDPRGYPNAASLQWLPNTPLLNLLVDALGPESPAEGQANAAEVLAAIARSVASPLTTSMATPQFMERLIDAALAPHDGRAATHALNVCIALLEPPPPANPTPGAPYVPMEIHEQLRSQAIKCVAAAAERLVALLEDSSGGGELKTSYGFVRQRVGQLRLKAVDLIAALLRTGDPDAETAIMKTQAVQRAMQLFVEYPFNNALHGGVAALLTAFESGSDKLREYLLCNAGLVDWLVSAPEKVQPEPNPDVEIAETSTNQGDSPASPAERKTLRAGYCGHITQVANRLLQLAESSELVRDFLAAHDGWQQHVKERLEPRNKLESVFAWQCGRPATLGQNLGAGSGLYQGDLGYSGLDSGSFSRDVYQRYGVYDDEEEDEEEGGTSEWTMELPSSGGDAAQGTKDEEESTSFTGFVIPGNGPSSPPGAELGMDDMQDDAVVLEDDGDDEYDAAEVLVELQQTMEGLSVSGGPAEQEEVPVLERCDTPRDLDAAVEAARGVAGVKVEKTKGSTGNGPLVGSSSASPGSEGAGTLEEEDEVANQFNANQFWKPTFEVPIDETS